MSLSRKIPVLTYHSAQVDGLDYATNDHIAMREDLETITAEGFRVVPLAWIAEWVLGRRSDLDMDNVLALTLDDGCTMDFRDMDHPAWGRQRGCYGILDDFRRAHPDRQPSLHATTFVIGSPEVRQELGKALAGPEWISDDWWREAAHSGLMSVENHSWDHNHPAARTVLQRDGGRGRFDNLETFAECDGEVRFAAEYIEQITGQRPRLFAFPWGQASEYFVREYFPHHLESHQCMAAFTAHDGFVTESSGRWTLPRLVFRANWGDQQAFRALLREARS